MVADLIHMQISQLDIVENLGFLAKGKQMEVYRNIW